MKSSELDIKKIASLYTIDKLSTYEIAEKLNTYPNMISRALKKMGIRIRTKSDAQKASLETGKSKHPTLGKPRPESVKLTLSKKSRENWKDLDDSEKQRRISDARERWNNLPQSKRDDIAKRANEAVRLASREGSQLEKLLLMKLKEFGYDAQHHRHILENNKMEVDIFIPALKTAIEIDGPSHFLPIWGEDKLKKVMESDLQKNGLIISRGFVLVRIKCKVSSTTLIGEHELVNKLRDILDGIKGEFPKNVSDRYIELDFD